MKQEVLTVTQKKAIAFVAKEVKLSRFYLTGGTALSAYYLRHRISEDLDFFVFKEPDKLFLHAFADQLKNALKASAFRFERLYDRNQFFFQLGDGELKIEFTKYPFRQLEQPIMHNGIRVDSLRDISANKMMAMLDRFDPKDFVDLYFLLRKFQLKDIRKDVEKKFEMGTDNIFLGGELMKARRIEALPKMLKPLILKDLKTFFAEQAKQLGPQIFKD